MYNLKQLAPLPLATLSVDDIYIELKNLQNLYSRTYIFYGKNKGWKI